MKVGPIRLSYFATGIWGGKDISKVSASLSGRSRNYYRQPAILVH